MNKPLIFLAFIVVIISTKIASAQVIDTPIEHFQTPPKPPPPPRVYEMFPIKGKVIGVNLEDVNDVMVINKRTAEQTITNSRGLFTINAAKDDTITFQVSRYSKDIKIIKRPKDNLDVILFKRKTDELPANHTSADYSKALKADEELYRILVKDAKLEGKWGY